MAPPIEIHQAGDNAESGLGTVPGSLLWAVWRRKSLLALAVTASLVLGVLYYAQKPFAYESRAQVLVIKKHSDSELVGPVGGLAHVEDYVATQQVLIKSPLIVERAVARLDHDVAGGQVAPLKTLWGRHEDVADSIVTALTVSRGSRDVGVGANNILNLAYRGGYPEECRLVLDAVIASYQEFLDEKYKDSSVEAVGKITEAKDALLHNLDKLEKEYDQFRRAEGSQLIKSAHGMNMAQERIADLEAKRSALLTRQLEVQAQVDTLEKALKAGTPPQTLALWVPELNGSTSTDSRSRALEQLTPLLLEEQKQQGFLGPDHPDVIDTHKRIEFLRQLLSHPVTAWGAEGPPASQGSAARVTAPVDPLETHLHSLHYELDRLRLSEGRLEESLQKQEEDAKILTGYERRDETYKKAIGRTEQFVDGITKQLQTASLIKGFGGYTATAIAPAKDGRQVEPNPYAIFPLAVFLGLAAGLGLCYLAEISDKSFRTPEEIRRRLGLPVIGHIPYHASMNQASEADSELAPSLLAFHQPQSREAEAYRGVRTALYFSTLGEGHKFVQVTSPNAGDGKTTLASNLAVSIAQSGKKVLLIDADLRRPRVHKLFGLTPRAGLSTVIAGQDALEEAIQHDVLPHLSILPSGPTPFNPAELLTSPRFVELLESIRQQTTRYDFVLVDTPPLLAVTDPCVVAPHVDGILLTIRISRHGHQGAVRAKEILGTLGVAVVGVVVNGTGRSGLGVYGYGDYRYGYYGYGYADDYASHGPEAQPVADGQEDEDEVEGNGAPPMAAESKPETGRRWFGWVRKR